MPGGIVHIEDRPVVRVDAVNHYYGEGQARNQVLYKNSIEIGAGQLVIMTGPSGSGKTTLLSLIGALRSVQEGTIQILDRDLTGLAAHDLVTVRRNLGFIFQAHNLFDSLSAYENVGMAMQVGGFAPDEMRERGMQMLERLGISHIAPTTSLACCPAASGSALRSRAPSSTGPGWCWPTSRQLRLTRSRAPKWSICSRSLPRTKVARLSW